VFALVVGVTRLPLEGQPMLLLAMTTPAIAALLMLLVVRPTWTWLAGWIIVPLFLAAVTVGGLLHGYLRLRTNSVWPATHAHATHNYFWDLFTGLTVATSPVAAEYLAGESAILPIVGYGILAVWLLARTLPRTGSAAVPTRVAISTA
jgi:hypothetical protein